jgi:hypothetical protein
MATPPLTITIYITYQISLALAVGSDPDRIRTGDAENRRPPLA